LAGRKALRNWPDFGGGWKTGTWETLRPKDLKEEEVWANLLGRVWKKREGLPYLDWGQGRNLGKRKFKGA